MAHTEVSINGIDGSARAEVTRRLNVEQRNVYLSIGDDEVVIRCYGDDETRQLMKALASASGGLLATLPDEYSPLEERDESAMAVEQERWPSVAEVSGEVYAPSCRLDGCTPDDPCVACQSLAGAQGAGTQGGER